VLGVVVEALLVFGLEAEGEEEEGDEEDGEEVVVVGEPVGALLFLLRNLNSSAILAASFAF